VISTVALLRDTGGKVDSVVECGAAAEQIAPSNNCRLDPIAGAQFNHQGNHARRRKIDVGNWPSGFTQDIATVERDNAQIPLHQTRLAPA
jgi:hypothetical protein